MPTIRPFRQLTSPAVYGGRRRRYSIVLLSCLALFFFFYALPRIFRRSAPVIIPSSTLVFRREDVQSIWLWELASGHHPSCNSVPAQIGLETIPVNPARPLRTGLSCDPTTHAIGPARTYLDVKSQPPNIAYPPRPQQGSIADLDIIFEHCDFDSKKYVRDCLEMLRVGAGLDNSNRLRRDASAFKYIFTEESPSSAPIHIRDPPSPRALQFQGERDQEQNVFVKSVRADWEPTLTLPKLKELSTQSYCDPDDPRIFHMYWTGDFTDKPYLALLSFLYTQNLGFDGSSPACPPKLWLWINPRVLILNPSASARKTMYDRLRLNKWSAPFLHPRFKDVIEFKFWNTTEQLDSLPELRNDWRQSESPFNSGGHTFNVPAEGLEESTDPSLQQLEDRLSVVTSDMVRFIVCHRYGGIYLDADTLFLRDWEELWGWKGAFAYRWSYHPKYNTAVFRLKKGSALGTFLLRTALKNGMDFHPMHVSDYLKDAKLEPLLYRLPDAMFDSAWLNMEGYQRDRPPQPFFTSFGEFFETPLQYSAAPQVVGFNGFFKGAFSYHFHNSWWRRVDKTRDFPDLAPRISSPIPLHSNETESVGVSPYEERELDWSAVLKRTFEAYIRGETPNMYGEWLQWP